jgi:hypothetical protein
MADVHTNDRARKLRLRLAVGAVVIGGAVAAAIQENPKGFRARGEYSQVAGQVFTRMTSADVGGVSVALASIDDDPSTPASLGSLPARTNPEGRFLVTTEPVYPGRGKVVLLVPMGAEWTYRPVEVSIRPG